MDKHNVRTPEQALAYLTECNLATVSDLAARKTPPKQELKRQTEMAQLGINWIKQFETPDGLKDQGGRIKEVLQCASVDAWAQRFRPS